jgi:hypothetical protein
MLDDSCAGSTAQTLSEKLEVFKNSGDSFETFMNNLESKESQLLWKNYERERQGDVNSTDHWARVSGTGTPGIVKKKRALLQTFVKNGCKCDANYLSMASEVVQTTTQTIEREWKPWKEIEARYGEEEALAHVKVGAIKRKRNPANPRQVS